MKFKPTLLLVLLLSTMFSFAQNTLKLDAIFSSKMVLQRQQNIPVWGLAKPETKVEVIFRSDTISTYSDNQGAWRVNFKAYEAGGPFTLLVQSEKESITLNEILIGEVWLASGQSNMHLDLKRTLDGDRVAKNANNPNIRLYYMKPTFPTGKDGVHTLEELDKIQNNQYFNTQGWMKVTPENVLYFSAVAYYFSEKLQEELDVPIGIIHNAVPGSPIESWLSRKDIKQDSVISNYVEQRWVDKEDEKDAMISVAKKQISLKNPGVKQKHPWMPNYNYKNGILPLIHTPIKGVIWYQGESNAESPGIYKTMFSKMVKTWRADWNLNFPFYYVQLTSREDRPAWPEFRFAQSELLNQVPNSKMVVITDAGDRQDTHAKNKKPVGERLALMALGDTYHILKNYESPMFDSISVKKNKFTIHFKGAFKCLKTSDGNAVVGFEISEDNKQFRSISPKIQGKKVTFKYASKNNKTLYVRYAWKSYTEANLVSKKGLPVSTFRTKI
ncbi:sialate O-acetylesterase [Tamlana haliotis]|uniref:Sialate O-acetylesterase n=1 Tax=Pseudotamlana haliotis TaxID=2614804 RepID=A0A6N6MGJ4_9FLAO|nr:sialate O-acetylesterase [Tamlana haliotis]KAB1068064.1 sialate O-acetylesterase [Tamlana haliotis]